MREIKAETAESDCYKISFGSYEATTSSWDFHHEGFGCLSFARRRGSGMYKV